MADKESQTTFATAVTLLQQKTGGVVNFQTELCIREAVSLEEAKGKAVMAAMEKWPDHGVQAVLATPVCKESKNA